MDLTPHVILVALALIATSSGFIANRQARQGFFARQHQRINQGMPPRRPVSRLSRRISSQTSLPQNSAINHRFSVRGLNRNSVPINIISNIFVNHPRSQKNATANPNRPTGSPNNGNSQVGQGRRHGQRGRNPQGRSRRPHRMFNGRGQGRNGRHRSGTGPGATGRQVMAVYNVQGHYPAGLAQLGHPVVRGHSPAGPSNTGHGQLVQLTLPVVNGSGLSSLLQGQAHGQAQGQGHGQTPGSGSTSGSGGSQSQVIILPTGHNAGTLVVSGGGLQFQKYSANNAASSNGKNSQKASGMVPPTTLQPGEDPPEVEGAF